MNKNHRVATVLLAGLLAAAALYSPDLKAQAITVRVADAGARVEVGSDAELPAGQSADAVVAVFGDATSLGEVRESVVAVFGNVMVDGPVGESVVAVFGDLTLGPNARVAGEAVAVGGEVTRDAAATVAGGVQSVMGSIPKLHLNESIRQWFNECYLFGRPLAFSPGLEWAWWFTGGVLLFYLLVTLLAAGTVRRCAETLEQQPGTSILAALLTMVLTPVIWLVLFMTIVGIIVIPFFNLLLMIVAVFGRIVFLAWLGRRVLGLFGEGAMAQTVLAVLLGGVLVVLSYTVPVLGFVMALLVGFVGFGAVAATMFVGYRRPAAAVAPPPIDAPAPMAAPAPLVAVATALGADAERASFWLRIGALAIDLLLIGAVTGMLPGDHGGFVLVLLAIYGALMWKLRGTTVGGIICRLRVVRLDGRPVDWATAIVRALGCFVSLLPAGLGFIWIAIDDNRQGWHDKIAGTTVVRVPAGASLI